MARYLIELSLVEYGMLKYSARNTAVSALYLACKIFKCTVEDSPAWNKLIEESSHFSEKEVRPCAKALCIILQNAPQSNLKACRRKFSK